MKKIILAVTLLAVAGSQVQSAKAGGWPVAAGVVGGLAVGTAIGATVARAPVYYAPAPVYYAPPTTYYYYQQAPVAASQPAVTTQTAPAIANAPTVPNAPTFGATAPAPVATYSYQAPTVVYSQPAPTVVYDSPYYYGYAPWPVVSFGFGFGRPYWGGYRGYYGHGFRR